MRSTERGAVIIHVAFALMALIVFTGFVIDQGSLYVARRQAQTAADAGALAGALTLETAPAAVAEATAAAKSVAGSNPIWAQGTAPADVIVAPIPWPCPASAGGGTGCIRVDVFRGLRDRDGGAHGNSMPTTIMGMVGLYTQGIKATATAQVAAGNAVRCIKPWVVADKWTDLSSSGLNTTAWDQMDDWNPGVDTYAAPGFKASGPGNDYGLELVLKPGNIGTWSSGWTMQIDFGVTGSSAYQAEIEGCPNYVPTVGLYDPSKPCDSRVDENPVWGCISVKTGVAQGPTSAGTGNLIALDSSATWNVATNTVQGGCMVTGTCLDEDGVHVEVSPRIVPLAIFDTATYAAAGFTGTNGVARVVNLLGFFIEGMCNDVYPNVATRPPYCGTPAEANKAVVGRLMNYPGQYSGASGSAGPSTFLKITRLVL